MPGAVTEDPAGRADLKHPLGRPGDEARFPEIARVRVPIRHNEANGVQAAHGLKVPGEQHEHPPKIPRLLDQHVINAARRVTPADFENHVALETLVAHQLRDPEARVGMPHVSPPERLLTHVTQDHVPLGDVPPERVERLINVIDELEPRPARVGQAQTDRDQTFEHGRGGARQPGASQERLELLGGVYDEDVRDEGTSSRPAGRAQCSFLG